MRQPSPVLRGPNSRGLQLLSAANGSCCPAWHSPPARPPPPAAQMDTAPGVAALEAFTDVMNRSLKEMVETQRQAVETQRQAVETQRQQHLSFLRNTYHESTDVARVCGADVGANIASVKSGLRGRTTRVLLKIASTTKSMDYYLEDTSDTDDLTKLFPAQGFTMMSTGRFFLEPLLSEYLSDRDIASIVLRSDTPLYFDEWIEKATRTLASELGATEVDICLWDVDAMLAGTVCLDLRPSHPSTVPDPLDAFAWLADVARGGFGECPVGDNYTFALYTYCTSLPSGLMSSLGRLGESMFYFTPRSTSFRKV